VIESHLITRFVIHLKLCLLILVNYANGSVINLSNNGLTSLDQVVFEPILQFFSASDFDPTVTYIDASSSELVFPI